MHYVEQAEYLLALTVHELATLTRVNRTTAKRWKSGESRIPFAAFALAALAIDGMLPPTFAGAAWSGWRFGRDGRLYAPDIKRGYEPHHIRQLDYLVPMFSWSQELRELVRRTQGERGHALSHARTSITAASPSAMSPSTPPV